MSDIVMPRLSDSMEEGTIVRWLVEDGQEVKTGEEIVEIETDKATMSYEADADGASAGALATRRRRHRREDLTRGLLGGIEVLGDGREARACDLSAPARGV